MENDYISVMLNKIPLEELTDSVLSIVEKFRYSVITESQAISSFDQHCKKEIEKLITNNKAIVEACK